MIDREAYCREIEAFLCRKNDGHLIRIVGPAFERVLGWADQGIPLKVAETGIDGSFTRYYRKGPRRHPVRIEFCEADVLDVFDEWRRAVGVSVVTPDAEGGPLVEEPGCQPGRPRRSLASHIEGAIARLTVLRGSDKLGSVVDEALAATVQALEAMKPRADHARGAARDTIIDEIAAVDRGLVDRLVAALNPAERAALTAEADHELVPFRPRMTADAYARSRDAALARLVRDRHGLPTLAF